MTRVAAFVVKSLAADPGFVLDVSPAVRDYVRSHGGRLFIWFEELTGTWALQKASTSSPQGDYEFDACEVDDLALFLQKRECWPDGIRLMLDPWWPFQPIAVPAGGEAVVPRRVRSSTRRFTV
jgi:L-alanine-DL-glutamate epimerase-like enolase superfamily enzyme